MTKIHWKLTDEVYEFIKGEVAHVFIKYKVRCIPVSGFEIATKMKITLIAYSSLPKKKLQAAMSVSQDGFFLETDGREFIFYNDIDRSYERQNWTLLHEIGHIVLDHQGHSEREEAEADFFAKFAIAPPVLVDKLKPKSPRDIREAFYVSTESAVYSYEYYGKWKSHHKKVNRYTPYEMQLIQLWEDNKTKASFLFAKEMMPIEWVV